MLINRIKAYIAADKALREHKVMYATEQNGKYIVLMNTDDFLSKFDKYKIIPDPILNHYQAEEDGIIYNSFAIKEGDNEVYESSI